MRTRRARVATVVSSVVVALALIGAIVTFGGFGDGDDTPVSTTFTAPRDTPAAGPTQPPPSLVRPRVAQARPWRTGFANGVMPLGLSDEDLAADLDGMAATGARWLRVDFYWPTVQEGGPDAWDWSSTDRVVQGVLERGMEVLAMPAYSPHWARPPGTSDHHPPLNLDDYARFVYEATKRYAPLGVDTWEIWNEPNVAAFWQPRPDPQGYADLLRRAYLAIKSVDPHATVISAGLAAGLDRPDGSTLSARTFLERVYEAGAGDAFDAVGLHPQSFPALPGDAAYWNSFYNAPTVYQVMVDHDDADKVIWGTEFATPTGPSEAAVTPEFQRDIVAAGYRAWLAWDFTGPLLVYAYRDYANEPYDREANFGLLQFDRTPKLAFDAFVAMVDELERRATPVVRRLARRCVSKPHYSRVTHAPGSSRVVRT